MKRSTRIIIIILIGLVASYTIIRCSEAKPAQIPTELFKCELKQMRVGDIGYCGATAMIVDVEGRAYLWGFTDLEKGMSLNDGWLRIERKTDGYYVSLKLGKQKWVNDKTYYWKPYTVKVNSQPEEIVDLKKMVKSGSIFPVKKVLLYRDRLFYEWFRKDQVDEYEEKLPKEVLQK